MVAWKVTTTTSPVTTHADDTLIDSLLTDEKYATHENYVEAAALLRTAIEGGASRACYNLGLLYEYGKGVQQSYELAHKYYTRGMEQHDIDSMYNLAMLYAYGRGVTQDFHKARQLLEISAQIDHPPSVYYIGIFKTYGYASEINYEQAINWFERAASLDDYRVSHKATQAAAELRQALSYAQAYNEDLMNKYQSRTTS